MKHIQFEWDDEKNKSNRKNHKVSFEEAKTVFFDPGALLIHDPDHSEDEERFIIMGISQTLKILVVCHCYRANDEVIRIISARKANRYEIKQYGGKNYAADL
jgi:uncharacterized protein